MDQLSTKNSLDEQLPSCVQTDCDRAQSDYDLKFPQIKTKIKTLETMYSQVVNDLNQLIRGYEERNGTIEFENERPSDGKRFDIKLGYRALVEQEKYLKIFRYAYAQAGKSLDYMASEVEKVEEGRDGTSTFNKNGDCPVVPDHGHSELQQNYQSNVVEKQKMQDTLKGMEYAFQNSLADYELEIHRYYDEKCAAVEVKLMRLKEHLDPDGVAK